MQHSFRANTHDFRDRTWYSLAEFLGTEYVPETDDSAAVRYDSGDFSEYLIPILFFCAEDTKD